jgi:hypothetical protein
MLDRPRLLFERVLFPLKPSLRPPMLLRSLVLGEFDMFRLPTLFGPLPRFLEPLLTLPRLPPKLLLPLRLPTFR